MSTVSTVRAEMLCRVPDRFSTRLSTEVARYRASFSISRRRAGSKVVRVEATSTGVAPEEEADV